MSTATETKTVSIEVDRGLLIEALNTATAFTLERTHWSILKHVCVDASRDSPVVVATDGSIGCRASLSGVVVKSPGRFILPPKRAVQLLTCASGATVAIEASAEAVVIRSWCGEHRFPYLDPDEFPSVAEFNESNYHEVSAKLFRELVRRTVFATDQENSRYALGGVLLEMDEQKITGIATDGRRLAKMEGAAHAVGDPTVERVIIPARLMTMMWQVFSGDGNILIAAGEHNTSFKGDPATISVKNTEGRFPKWRDVIPDGKGRKTFSFVASDLLSCLSEASLFSDLEQPGINFSFSRGRLNLKYSCLERGVTSSVSMPVKCLGNTTAFLLDHRYVIDCLRAIDPSQNVTMSLKGDGDGDPVLIATDDGYEYVVMRLRSDD